MFCSKCSETIKPVVALDIDGTIGDYHSHFLRFACDYLGIGLQGTLAATLRSYKGDIAFSVYCCQVFDIKIGTYREIKLAYRQGGLKRSMPILPWARPLTNQIKEQGAELWITTTRPYLSLDNVVPDTREWLNRHEIAFDYLLFDEDKYVVLAERVDSERVAIVLDDLPEMYDAAAEQFGYDVPCLVKGQFNQAVKRNYMTDLRGARFKVTTAINNWRANYGA